MQLLSLSDREQAADINKHWVLMLISGNIQIQAEPSWPADRPSATQNYMSIINCGS